MSNEHEDQELNEFAYTPEEQAEIDKLNALNADSEEIHEELDPDELEVDEETIKNLTDPQDTPELGDEPDPEKEPEVEVPGGKTDNEPAPTHEHAAVEEELPPAPNYDDQLQAQKEKIEQAEQAIQDVSNQLRQLSVDYDEGEISQDKYDYDRQELQRKLSKLDTALEREGNAYSALEAEANQKIDEYQEIQREAWHKDVRAFLSDPSNELLRTNANVATQFDEVLISMGKAGMLDGLSHEQILTSVRTQLAIRVPELAATPYTGTKPTKEPEKPAKPTKTPTHPSSLSSMQAQELPADDPFAHVRKLSGVKYEEAIANMSPEQQDKFFFG